MTPKERKVYKDIGARVLRRDVAEQSITVPSKVLEYVGRMHIQLQSADETVQTLKQQNGSLGTQLQDALRKLEAYVRLAPLDTRKAVEEELAAKTPPNPA